jgi:hypothetical protein
VTRNATRRTQRGRRVAGLGGGGERPAGPRGSRGHERENRSPCLMSTQLGDAPFHITVSSETVLVQLVSSAWKPTGGSAPLVSRSRHLPAVWPLEHGWRWRGDYDLSSKRRQAPSCKEESETTHAQRVLERGSATATP